MFPRLVCAGCRLFRGQGGGLVPCYDSPALTGRLACRGVSFVRHGGRDLDKELNITSNWAVRLDSQFRPGTVTRLDAGGIWLVEQVFTPAECEALVAVSEVYGYGATNYRKAYRGNLRLITADEGLASAVWKRLRPFVPPTLETDLEIWDAVGLNECWRLSKYHPGDRFGRHCDYSFARHNGEISLLTVNIYLNSNFEGGDTRFYADCGSLEASLTVRPQPGLCLLFSQLPEMYWHDGEEVRSGQKYLIRSDVMYRRRL